MEKKKIGRPEKYRPDFHPEDFLKQSRSGKQVIQIASSWDVHRDQLYEWAKRHPVFHDAFKRGRQYCEAFWIDLGYSSMLGMLKDPNDPNKKMKIDLGFYCFLSKATLGWRDTGPDDKNIKEEDELDTSVTPYVKV